MLREIHQGHPCLCLIQTHWTPPPGPATGEECWYNGLPLAVPHGGSQSCDPLDVIHLPGMVPYTVQRTLRFQPTLTHCSLVPPAAAAAAASPSALLPLAVFALLFMLQRIFHNAFILTCTLNILYVPLGRSLLLLASVPPPAHNAVF